MMSGMVLWNLLLTVAVVGLLARAHAHDSLHDRIAAEAAIRNLRAACDATLGETKPEMRSIKLVCPICGEPQFNTPSGATCCNGHGGVEGIEK